MKDSPGGSEQNRRPGGIKVDSMLTATMAVTSRDIPQPERSGEPGPPVGPGQRPSRRIVLASRSARRRALLEQHGIAHEAVDPPVCDSGLEPGRVATAGWVMALAYLKAWSVASRLGRSADAPVVIGADTVVVLDGEVIGQPRDADDARRIIRSLEGVRHDVLTGVALVDPAVGRREMFFDRATVDVGAIGRGSIESYIAGGEWAGKAGAYNLDERLRAGWPIRYEGDPTTIVGLPMSILPERLSRFVAAHTRPGAAVA